MNRFNPRWLGAVLQKVLKAMPVVVLTGARQTGKTTLVEKLKGRRFYSLDKLDVLDQARNNPDSLLDELPVTIDEVQRAPELLLAIKRKVDEKRVKGGILLTGSANLRLMEKVTESLAGRAVYLELPPFCALEWQEGNKGQSLIDSLFKKDFKAPKVKSVKSNWEDTCLKGGFPNVIAEKKLDDREFWFTGYVQTYLERDLRQLTEVSNLSDFQRVMRLAALRTGRLLNQSELARDASVSQSTCHRFLNLMETGHLISRLGNYSLHASSPIVKSKKLMWTDSGLAAWLANIKTIEKLSEQLDRGFWFEQTVFQALNAWQALSPQRNIYFWRTTKGQEVDFILEDSGEVIAIELKLNTQIATSDLKGIRAFQNMFKQKGKTIPQGILLYGGSDARSLGENTWLVPAKGFL